MKSLVEGLGWAGVNSGADIIAAWDGGLSHEEARGQGWKGALRLDSRQTAWLLILASLLARYVTLSWFLNFWVCVSICKMGIKIIVSALPGDCTNMYFYVSDTFC